MLFAAKNRYDDLVSKLLGDEPGTDSMVISSEINPSTSLWKAARDLTTRLTHGAEDMKSLENASQYTSLFFWVSSGGYTAVAWLLLELKGIKVSSEKQIQECSSLHNAAGNGRIEELPVLMSENGVDIN